MMKCDRCQNDIDPGEDKEYQGLRLCEDCYVDALSPVKTCDPWAVYCAKSLEQHCGAPPALTPLQKEILQILSETGAIAVEAMLARLNLTRPQLEQEFAALRHMEKVRGERRGQQIFIRLW